jgi:hypothetical protein
MTRAPCSRAIWTAALPTPLPAPITSTSSPGRTRARVTSMCHAVRNTSGTAAACSHGRFSGYGRQFTAGTHTASA